jgi:hypothetical protein
MKRRIIGNIITGLGSSSQDLLNNQWTDNEDFNNILKQCFEEAIDTFKPINEFGGLDFAIDGHMIRFGFEPTYMHEHLYIININLEDKTCSYIKTGIAWGAYGSDIAANIKFYSSYKNKGKFVKFIDKWFPILKENKKYE